MSEPFDRSRPSPIGIVREFLARGQDSVVAVGGMTALQDQAYIRSDLDARLESLLLSTDAPDLIVISGSAGFGKSALIASIEAAHPDVFEEVVQDATHADSPSETQADALLRFFEPFADGNDAPGDRPRIIAVNTGMVIQFFHQLRERGISRFSSLEGVLTSRLGLSAEASPDTPWSAAVINLDLRATAGPGGLVAGIFERLDFTNPDGILGDSPRCETCTVRDYCPVRTNSLLAARSTAAIDRLLAQAAVERSRHSGPRQLYDIGARILMGDDGFDADLDPCEAVAAAANRDDSRWVWDHLLPANLFALGGELGNRLGALDPSLSASSRGHDILATAGLRPDRDAKRINSLGGSEMEAIETAARYVAGGISGAGGRADLGRALVAADFLADPEAWDIGDRTAREFSEILATYERWSRDPAQAGDISAISRLMHRIEQALARTFGVVVGTQPYLPVHSYDPREPSRIFVKGNLQVSPNSFELLRDPAHARDLVGADLAGYQPLAVTARLGGAELAITLPVFRLVDRAARRTLASTADLERFYALRHAVEALARRASEGPQELMVERPGTDRHYIVTKVPGLIPGQEVFSAQEVGR